MFTYKNLRSPLISVVLPTYNRLAYTKKTLTGIIENTTVDYELLIWDNRSEEPGMKDWLSQFERKHSHTLLIESSKNIGPSPAYRNLISMARGKYIVILNNDILVSKEWLKDMLDIYQGLPPKSLLRSTLLQADSKSIHNMGASLQQQHPKFATIKHFYHDADFDNDIPNLKKVDLAGCPGLMLKKEYKTTANFSPQMFMGLTDWHFTLRFREEGFQTYCTGDVALTHLESDKTNAKYRDFEEFRFSPAFLGKSLEFFLNYWGWLPLSCWPIYLRAFPDKELLTELLSELENSDPPTQHKKKYIATICKLCSIRSNNENYWKKMLNNLEKLSDKNDRLLLQRMLARQCRDDGNFFLMEKLLKTTLKEDPESKEAIGDWFQLARYGNGKIKTEAINKLQTLKPELLKKVNGSIEKSFD